MAQQTHSPVGKTKDAGWEIGVRRTLPVEQPAIWDLLTSPEGLAIWLGEGADLPLTRGETYTLADGSSGELRVLKPYSHLRITWQPGSYPRPSLIQVRAIARKAKTEIAFHQEHLPGPEARSERQTFFVHALDRLEALIAAR